jgi:hypothetical protein
MFSIKSFTKIQPKIMVYLFGLSIEKNSKTPKEFSIPNLLVDPHCSYKTSIAVSVTVAASRFSLLYSPQVISFNSVDVECSNFLHDISLLISYIMDQLEK